MINLNMDLCIYHNIQQSFGWIWNKIRVNISYTDFGLKKIS